jgi:hypothetical protein
MPKDLRKPPSSDRLLFIQVTDTIRDLLISLASHMAYMQGQLEARHELDDPEDYYWYRESVLLRQKVTDVLLADEPAAVTGQPSDQELLDIAASTIEPYERSSIATDEYEPETESAVEAYGSELIAYARAVLARWGNLKGSLTSSPPADGEVAECAAELLQRQVLVPVSVSERPPEDQLCWWFEPDEEDDEAYGSSWTLLRICGGTSSYTHWLPAHALPLPEVNND